MEDHTPGPWEVSMEDRVGCCIVSRAGLVAQCDGTVDARLVGYVAAPTKGEWRKNAALIAAAPDLLRALELFADFAGEPCRPGEFGANLCQHRDCEAVRQARAAIARARGQ